MIIKIKVISNSSQDEIIGMEGDMIKIKCKASPEKGKANQAVIGMLAKHYRVSQSSIKILKGKTSSIKYIKIKTK